jgi:hypothetical protein
MSAQVSNLAMVGSAARLSRALAVAGGARNNVDGVDGAGAAPARDQAGASPGYDRYESGPSPRRPLMTADRVVSFGGVLVSSEVGAVITQTQALNGTFPLSPVEAERQIANYEFAQSLMGPPEVGQELQPFQ